jgi:hypothetical protein
VKNEGRWINSLLDSSVFNRIGTRPTHFVLLPTRPFADLNPESRRARVILSEWSIKAAYKPPLRSIYRLDNKLLYASASFPDPKYLHFLASLWAGRFLIQQPISAQSNRQQNSHCHDRLHPFIS